MKVPFIDLKAQQEKIFEKLTENIQDVLIHGKYIMGPEVFELERKLAEYVGVSNAVSCSSGTDALLMALMAYDVGPGDAIFTTPFTFVATAEVIAMLGATPVFVDICEDDFNMDPDRLKTAIEALLEDDPNKYPLPANYAEIKPRGVIAVDLFGQPADYERINAIAADYGMFVVEDAAQSFGAECGGRKACGLADVAATSFFPAKPLGGYGDSGMVFTNNDDLAERLKSIRIHGKGRDKYDNVRIGINGRMDTLQAAVLLAKFELFPGEVDSRQLVADRYASFLEDSVKCPEVRPGRLSAWAQYSVLSEQRELIQKQLAAEEVPTAVYYPIPLHLQSGYAFLGYGEGDFPVCEDIAGKIFSLPMHPYLSEDDQRFIANVIKTA